MLNKRAQNLVDAMPEGFEAALIQTQVSRFYFLDFDAHDAGTLLILPDSMIYIIDSRYIELAKRSVQNAQVLLEINAMNQVAEILKSKGVKKLYVESEISLSRYNANVEKFTQIEVEASPVLSKGITALRTIKDEEEVRRMQEAQRVTDECFVHILPFIKEGVREIDLMLEMEHFMRANGADAIAFDTIFVAGANSSMPHGVPGKNKIKAGDLITMDFGAKYKGYCADMTRTVAFGKIGDEQKKIYELVLKAHLAGIEASKAGVRGKDVDKVARDIIEAAGYGEYFGHGLGHAVGIEVHEEPRYSFKEESEIKAGTVMTVEPGCYLPGKFGCRIEDMVLITQTGCVPFPKSDKQLIVL